MKWPSVFAITGALLAATEYEAAQSVWRKSYEEKLKSPTGWAAVAGLFWLHEGENSVGSAPGSDVLLPAPAPTQAGKINLKNGKARVDLQGHNGEVKIDSEMFHVGALTLAVLKRDKRFAVRLWNPNAETIRHFSGLHWYPVDQKARITARWMAFPTVKKVPIVSVLGYTEMNDAPGLAEFTWNGKTYRLEPVIEEDHLFLMFKDPTSRTETYHSGRFLTVEMPKEGKVILDFNQARNPPCAFTPYATCPIPPKQNWLDFPMRAGEKRYEAH